MQKREINPTEWLGAFNINHAIEVTGAQRVLYISGFTEESVRKDDDGEGVGFLEKPMSPKAFMRTVAELLNA